MRTKAERTITLLRLFLSKSSTNSGQFQPTNQFFKNSTTTKPTKPYTFLTQRFINYSTMLKEKENYNA